MRTSQRVLKAMLVCVTVLPVLPGCKPSERITIPVYLVDEDNPYETFHTGCEGPLSDFSSILETEPLPKETLILTEGDPTLQERRINSLSFSEDDRQIMVTTEIGQWERTLPDIASSESETRSSLEEEISRKRKIVLEKVHKEGVPGFFDQPREVVLSPDGSWLVALPEWFSQDRETGTVLVDTAKWESVDWLAHPNAEKTEPYLFTTNNKFLVAGGSHPTKPARNVINVFHIPSGVLHKSYAVPVPWNDGRNSTALFKDRYFVGNSYEIIWFHGKLYSGVTIWDLQGDGSLTLLVPAGGRASLVAKSHNEKLLGIGFSNGQVVVLNFEKIMANPDQMHWQTNYDLPY